MGCDEYRKKNHNKLSLVVFAANLAIKNSFNNVFRWQRHFEEKMEAICNFFSLLAFCPFYPTAGLLPDHELREVLQSKKITILGSKSTRDLKQPPEAVKKRRGGPRGIEWVEATSNPITFQPNSENCKRYKKRTSKLRLSSLRSKCDTIPGYNLT